MQESVFPQLTLSSKCFTKLSAQAKQFVITKWNQWKF